MGETKFTKMQQAAIDIRDKNILVSAAAGSGKTAVLVQRIINRILDEKNPIDIDRILVMTFTRAAAAQMKERILDAINKKRSENPHDKNLNRQYALVHSAYIMTIDSFCMNIVRNHFEEIGLSPDFRMADEGEITLIKQDVLSDVLEKAYENGNEAFLKMTETFASRKTDIALEKQILSLYDYAMSYPDPEEWLDNCLIEYNSFDPKKSEWLIEYTEQIRRDLLNVRKMLDDAGDVCTMEFGPSVYLPAIESDIELVDSILSFEDYSELYERCSEKADFEFAKFARLSLPKEGEATSDEISARTRLKSKVSGNRDKAKKIISNVIESVNSASVEEIKYGFNLMMPSVVELVNITKEFAFAFDEKKREKNVVDFNDLEHMCLSILRKGKDTTARQYREFFEEIYVDEYQDSNYLQEEIVSLISKNEPNTGNVFMVGDVKQSIYGFRNAKPEIFIEKYEKYSRYFEELNDLSSDSTANIGEKIENNEEKPDVRVDLSHNFRSRREVLASVNSIFSKIMTKSLGGIEYDDAAALHAGREYIKTDNDYTTELNLLISDNEVNDREAEALMVANKIKELKATLLVEDSDSETGTRSLKYSDIVILLRTAKGWDNVFVDVLTDQGIPVFVASSTGYFETMEVKTLLNFLKVIDNPLQDIPLTAVMMSVIGNFYEEEVALIRSSFKDGYLYDALLNFYSTYCVMDENSKNDIDEGSNINSEYGSQMQSILQKDSNIVSKICKFIDLITYFRKKSEYTPVSEILTELIDGDYGMMIKAMPGGQKKYANLNMLLKKAQEYGKTSYKGIFQFNRYIEAIRKYEIDYGEANLSDESDDTVRIMSIHKSKGLEFPVCFISGMSKSFNMMDTRATVLTDSKYGIATDIVDIDRRLKSKSLFKAALANKKQKGIVAEEMRLFYVAMTRAKEKLIMTGVVKSKESINDANVQIDKASSYLDMYSYVAEGDHVDDIEIKYVSSEDLVDELVEETTLAEVTRNKLISIINGNKNILVENNKNVQSNEDVDTEADEFTINDNNSDMQIDTSIIKERMSYKYPYEDKGTVKLSVSELKHRYQTETDLDSDDTVQLESKLYDYEPGQTNNAALHGTAVHRIFEIWDYGREVSRESVDEFLRFAHDEKLIEDDLFDMVRKDEVYDFVSSDIASRMKKAYEHGELYREQPFVICDDPDDPDSMLVQGIIDAYFIEDGEIVLVDYKTDRGKSEAKLIEDHGIQLKYYGKALERMLHLKLKESVIYSTFLRKSIII